MYAPIDVPSTCPQIILEVGPCRSGTTAHVRLFAQAGIPAYYQPIKTLLQQQRLGNTQIRLSLPSATQAPVIFIKETIGAYTELDSTMNPLRVLIDAGVPPQRLRCIGVMREPLATVTAWKQMTAQTTFPPAPNHEELFQHFVFSCSTVQNILHEARTLGVPITSFVQEVLRDHGRENVVRSLFARVRIVYMSTCFSGWQDLPSIDDPESHITLLLARHGQTLHQKLEQSEGLMYYAKDPENIDTYCSPAEVQTLIESGVMAMYEQMRHQCEEDLGLAIAPSKELEHYWQRHREGGYDHERNIGGQRSKER